MEDHIGESEDVKEAKTHIAEVESQNDEGIFVVLSKIRDRLLQDKMLLEGIKSSSSHLVTQFLITQASSTIGVAERLITAALDLSPVDPKQIDDLTNNNPESPDDGVGQYL